MENTQAQYTDISDLGDTISAGITQATRTPHRRNRTRTKHIHHSEYVGSGHMEMLQVDTLRETTDWAAHQLRRYDFDALAFRGMSGAVLAPVLALRLNKTLIMVRKQGDSSHSSHRVEGDRNAERYIIVDDFVSSGATALEIRANVHRFAPNAVCLGVLETDVYRRQRSLGSLRQLDALQDGYDWKYKTPRQIGRRGAEKEDFYHD